jgi:hypothetical protein
MNRKQRRATKAKANKGTFKIGAFTVEYIQDSDGECQLNFPVGFFAFLGIDPASLSDPEDLTMRFEEGELVITYRGDLVAESTSVN